MRIRCALTILIAAGASASAQPVLVDGPQQRIEATYVWYDTYLGAYLDPAAWDIGRVANDSKRYTYDVRFPDLSAVSTDAVEFPVDSFVRIGTLDVRDTFLYLKSGSVLRVVDPSPNLSGRFRLEESALLQIDSPETRYLGSEILIYAGATARLRGHFVTGYYPWHNNFGPLNTVPTIRVFGGTADLTQLGAIRSKSGEIGMLDITAEGADEHPGLIDLSGRTRFGAALNVKVTDGGTVRLRTAPPGSSLSLIGDGRVEFVQPADLSQTQVTLYNTSKLVASAIIGLDGASITLDRVASANDPQDYERHQFDAAPEMIRSDPDNHFKLTSVESDVRLLGTRLIEGPFEIELFGESTFQADSLETIDSRDRPDPRENQNARFSYSRRLAIDGSEVTLPSLKEIASPVSIELGVGAVLRLPEARFAYPSTLYMQPGSVLEAPGLDSFANWHVRFRSGFGQPLPAPVYPAAGDWDNATIANESGLPVDIPITTYLSSTYSGFDGADLTFSRLRTIRQGPVQQLVIVATRGTIAMPVLERFLELPCHVLEPVALDEPAGERVPCVPDRRLRLDMLGDPAGREGRIEMPRLRQLPEKLTFNLSRAGRFVFGGSLHLDETDTFLLDEGTLELAGGFEITYPILGKGRLSGTKIALVEPGRATLEALAPDRGVTPTGQRELEDSMGISEIVIDPRSGAKLVSLVDARVNDSESEPGSEAVYVFGREVLSSASAAPLSLASGAILELGGVNLYYFDLAQLAFVHVNALIQEGENGIEFGDGYVCRTYCAGDADRDGVLTQGDLTVFVDLYLAESPYADANFDGQLDGADIEAFVAAFLAGC